MCQFCYSVADIKKTFIKEFLILDSTTSYALFVSSNMIKQIRKIWGIRHEIQILFLYLKKQRKFIEKRQNNFEEKTFYLALFLELLFYWSLVFLQNTDLLFFFCPISVSCYCITTSFCLKKIQRNILRESEAGCNLILLCRFFLHFFISFFINLSNYFSNF